MKYNLSRIMTRAWKNFRKAESKNDVLLLGMDLKALQAILGHSTLAMTADLYVDVIEKTKREELRKVMGAL